MMVALKVININNVCGSKAIVLLGNSLVASSSTWKDATADNRIFLDCPDNRSVGNSIVSFLHHVHISGKLNSIVSLPFQEKWMPRLLPKAAYPSQAKLVIVEENSSLLLRKNCIDYLRKRWPKAVIACRLTNPMSDYLDSSISSARRIRLGKRLISDLSHLYDRVYAWDKKDAAKYGWSYLGPVLSAESLPSSKYPPSDLFFIGQDKGRLDMIHRVLDWAHDCGLTTDFHVIGVPENRQLHAPGIEYNRKLPYEEVLARMGSARCILDLVPHNHPYLTLRDFESVVFGKKLLTNNPEVRGMPYFDPRQMCVSETLDDIDPGFLDDPFIVRYGGDWSPVRFVERVCDDLGI